MATNQNTNKKGRFSEYFKGVRVEMKKVIWPTKSEVVSYTAVVVATCALFALGFFLVDSGVLLVLGKLLGVDMG